MCVCVCVLLRLYLCGRLSVRSCMLCMCVWLSECVCVDTLLCTDSLTHSLSAIAPLTSFLTNSINHSRIITCQDQGQSSHEEAHTCGGRHGWTHTHAHTHGHTHRHASYAQIDKQPTCLARSCCPLTHSLTRRQTKNPPLPSPNLHTPSFLSYAFLLTQTDRQTDTLHTHTQGGPSTRAHHTRVHVPRG